MRRWSWPLGGAAVCVCCVLPSYEGADTLPGRPQIGGAGDGGAESGGGGRSSTSNAMAGEEAAGGVGATAGDSAGTSTGGNAGAAGDGAGGELNPGGGAGGGGPQTGEVDCPDGVLGHCAAGVTYPTYAGYTLALVEDFPVALDLNEDPIWTWSDGAPLDGQTGFREANISFADGKMFITAEQPAGCDPMTTNPECIAPRTSYAEAVSPEQQADVAAMGVWSGELRTKYNNYRYGRYELKFSAPIANPGYENTDNLSGNYLANMFVFRTPRNLTWAEINLVLAPSDHDGVGSDVVTATGAIAYPSANAASGSFTGPSGYAITQEHLYAFNWTPTKIEWFLDGQLIRTFTGSEQVPIPSLSAKIMLNLWVFSGNVFGDAMNNKYPFRAAYDYFRFYKLNAETTYPCAPTPACLPAADRTASSQNNPKEVNYGQ